MWTGVLARCEPKMLPDVDRSCGLMWTRVVARCRMMQGNEFNLHPSLWCIAKESDSSLSTSGHQRAELLVKMKLLRRPGFVDFKSAFTFQASPAFGACGLWQKVGVEATGPTNLSKY